MRARKLRRLFAAMLSGAVLAFCGVAYAQEAKAAPGVEQVAS